MDCLLPHNMEVHEGKLQGTHKKPLELQTFGKVMMENKVK